MDVLILCATKGNNFQLSTKITQTLNELEMSNETICLEDVNLPLYTPTAQESGIPEESMALAKRVKDARSLVILGPEYNGSLPPIINNAIAWISVSSKDWREAFNGKFSVIGTHSGGGGEKVCTALRQQIEYLGSIVHPRVILTNYNKEYNPESGKEIFSSIKGFLK